MKKQTTLVVLVAFLGLGLFSAGHASAAPSVSAKSPRNALYMRQPDGSVLIISDPEAIKAKLAEVAANPGGYKVSSVEKVEAQEKFKELVEDLNDAIEAGEGSGADVADLREQLDEVTADEAEIVDESAAEVEADLLLAEGDNDVYIIEEVLSEEELKARELAEISPN